MPLSTNANPPPVYIRTRIPKTYSRQPIISRLISCHGVNVNIVAAMLGTSYRNDGWCDLELLGSPQLLEASLAYLQELNIEIFQLTLKSVLEARIKKSQTGGVISDSEIVDVPIEQMHAITEDEPENDLTVEEGQTTQTKVQVRIPKNYRAQPVIAGLGKALTRMDNLYPVEGVAVDIYRLGGIKRQAHCHFMVLLIREPAFLSKIVHSCLRKMKRLVSRCGLTINIISAILGADAQDDGWFDLEIWGRRKQILLCLRYLEQLGIAPRCM